MKKILYLLVLTALFVSCSSDDDTDPNNGNGNNNGMIDEKIIGKWKVEYSKTIKPAVYNETTGKPEYDEKEARITEYDGNFDGTEATIPKSGLFNISENIIEIKNDKTISINIAGVIKEKSISYKIEDNYLKWYSGTNNPTAVVKYSLKNNRLTMELIKAEGMILTYYTISEYSKITE